MTRKKNIHIRVDPKFYERIEAERLKFMKQNGLNRLSTLAFTGILEPKLRRTKNAKTSKRKKR